MYIHTERKSRLPSRIHNIYIYIRIYIYLWPEMAEAVWRSPYGFCCVFLLRFAEHRGRNCWQGYGFGTTAVGDAGIAGRGTVLGPPRPEKGNINRMAIPKFQIEARKKTATKLLKTVCNAYLLKNDQFFHQWHPLIIVASTSRP